MNQPNDPSRVPDGDSRRRWIDAAFLSAQVILGAALLLAAFRSGAAAGTATAEVLAAAAAALSLGLGIMALWRMRHSFRAAPAPSHSGRLERGGIYRWLRHPMYNAVTGLVVAICLMRPHPLVLGLGATNYLFYWIKSRYEERLLLRRYPDYAEYRRRTWGVGP